MNRLDTASFELASTILANAADMTLATVRADGAPHATTISFASEAMTLYAAIALDSHKAHDIRRDGRVALTVNAPYRDWNEIQGLSIDAVATMIDAPAELALASSLLLRKLPGYAALIAEPAVLPWPGMLFIRITPVTLTLLDYTQRFGHSEQFDLRAQEPAATPGA